MNVLGLSGASSFLQGLGAGFQSVQSVPIMDAEPPAVPVVRPGGHANTCKILKQRAIDASANLRNVITSRFATRAGLSALPLLAGCSAADPLTVGQLAIGAGLVVGSGLLVWSAVSTEPARITAAREEIQTLEAFLERARSPAERGAFLNTLEGTNASIAILTQMRDDVVDAVAECAKKILAWQDVIAVCDGVLAELGALPIENRDALTARIFALRQDALAKIGELTNGTLANLQAMAANIPDWIELQRAKAQRLTERAGLEQKACALATQIARLLGRAEDLILTTDATQAGVDNLIDELERVEVDLRYVRAFEEIDAVLMLGTTQGFDQAQFANLEKLIAERRKTRVAELAGGVG